MAEPISWKNCLRNSSLELNAAVRPLERGKETGFAGFLEELLTQFFIWD